MYSIVIGGDVKALCENPRYVKYNEDTDSYIDATQEDAIGIAVAGELYNINGGDFIQDRPQAIIKESDINEIVFGNMVDIKETAENAATAFVDVESAVCELDAATDERIRTIEEALCELDVTVNGGGENNG